MRALPLVAVALLLAACDSGESDAPPSGRFEAEFGGDLSDPLEGSALFQRLGETDEPAYLITMTDGSEGGRSLTLSHSPGAPSAEGTFQLGSDAPDGESRLFYVDRGTTGAFYEATRGTLRVTRSDERRIGGRFEADLAPVTEGAEGSASVVGSFDAVLLPAP